MRAQLVGVMWVVIVLVSVAIGGCSQQTVTAKGIDDFRMLPGEAVGVMYAKGECPVFESGAPVDAFQRIVAQGPSAVPELVRRLGDKTRINSSSEQSWPYGGVQLVAQYDVNQSATSASSVVPIESIKGTLPSAPALTVGDMCFSALGLIVNRGFRPRPLSGPGPILVNDLDERSEVVQSAKKEWANATVEDVINSLERDIVNPDGRQRELGAIVRLKFYRKDKAADVFRRRLESVKNSSGESAALLEVAQLKELAQAQNNRSIEEWLRRF